MKTPTTQKSSLAGLGIGVATMTFFMLLLQMRKELDAGQAIPRAFGTALQHAWPQLVVVVVIFVLSFFGFRFWVNGAGAEASDVNEVGRVRWERTRLYTTVMFLPAVLFNLGLPTFAFATGRWDDSVWIQLALGGLFAAMLIGCWVRKPDRDYLYFLGSGDASRINDEREQLIAGKSAATTLWFVAASLFICGSAYEVLVAGSFPWRSYCGFMFIFLIHLGSQAYWRRRL